MSGFQGFPPSTTPNYGSYPPQDPNLSVGYAMPPESHAGQVPQGYPPVYSQPSGQYTVPKQPIPQGMYAPPPQPMMYYPPFPPGQVQHQPFYPPPVHNLQSQERYPTPPNSGPNQPANSGPYLGPNPSIKSGPYPGSNQQTNSGPYLGSNQQATSGPYPGSNQQATSGPYPGSNQQATSGPYPGSNQQATSSPYSGSNLQATSGPYPGSNQQATSGPYPGSNQQATSGPYPGSNQQATSGPYPGSNQQAISGHYPGSNQQATSGPNPSSNQQATSGHYPGSNQQATSGPYPGSNQQAISGPYPASNQQANSGPLPSLNPYPENFLSKPLMDSNQSMNPGPLPQMGYQIPQVPPNQNSNVPYFNANPSGPLPQMGYSTHPIQPNPNPIGHIQNINTSFDQTVNSGPPPHQNPYPESMGPAIYPGPNQVTQSGPLLQAGYAAPQVPPNQNSNVPYLNVQPTGPMSQMGYPSLTTTGPYPDEDFCGPIPNAPLYEQIPKEFQEQIKECKQTATEMPPQSTNPATQLEMQAIITAAATEMASQMYPDFAVEQNVPLVEAKENQIEGVVTAENNVPNVQANGNLLAEPLAALAVTAIVEEQKAEDDQHQPTSGNVTKMEHCSKPAAEHSEPVLHNYGTIQPYEPFDSKKDAAQVKKAIKGFGTDEEVVVKILANRTLSQRKEIAHAYNEMYKKELVKDLKSELSGNLKEAVRALMMPRVRYLTKCLRAALIGRTTLQKLLVEIYFTSTNAEIHEINEIYKKEFKASLDKDLKREIPGYLRQIMVAINYGKRNESQHIDKDKVLADAKALCHSQIGCWGHIKSVFTELLILRSFAHLRQVFHEYHKMSKYTVQETLKREMSTNLLDGMLLIIECIENKITFFARLINTAIKTLTNDDAALIRIIVTRSEIDLLLIKDAYHTLYKKSLGKQIHSDTDGDYRKILLTILHTD